MRGSGLTRPPLIIPPGGGCVLPWIMTHRKPRKRFTWLWITALSLGGLAATAHAVYAPSASVSQYIPAVHKITSAAVTVPHKKPEPVVTYVNYTVQAGDTLTAI